MTDSFNIYFAGEIIEEQDPGQVRLRLAKLFNADDATLDKLFSGRQQLIKRACDRETALKYKQAMERAGARPLIKRADAGAEAPPPTPVPAPATPSAAERIAAVAAGSDPDKPGVVGDLRMEPPGSDVLRPEERSSVAPVDIDTSGLSAAAPGERLSAQAAPAPPAPDTSHLTLGAAGEQIPNLDRGAPPPPPMIDQISLAPEGTDFSDCSPAAPPDLDLDLSAIELAPAGADLLEPKERARTAPPPPATDHLSLASDT